MALELGLKVRRTCPFCKKVKEFTVTEWNNSLQHWVLRAPSCVQSGLMILNERE